MHKIKDMIKSHEGFSSSIYKDTEGNLTVGWGYVLTEGKRMPTEILDELFDYNFHQAVNDTLKLIMKYDICISKEREAVLIDMVFNLGLPRIEGFKKMIAALQAEDYQLATVEMLDSKWAKQVKGRAIELSEIMRTGRQL